MLEPFFSIVIPTYNRAKDLHAALKILTRQTFIDFEVIVSDNCSTDMTKNIAVSFKDKRIRYRKNRRNLGWIANLQKAINVTRGKYILLHGDDDQLINKYSLEQIYRYIVKFKFPGYIRINYLSKIEGEQTTFDFDISKKNNDIAILPPGKSSWKVIEFIKSNDPYFVTGICVKNAFKKNEYVIDSEFIPWFRLIYTATKKFGALYISEYLFFSKWLKKMRNPGHPYFYLKNGKFTFEQYFYEAKKVLNRLQYQKFIHYYTHEIIKNFPANKLSSNNINLLICADRVLKLSPKDRLSPYYWLMITISLITPKYILSIARKFYLYYYIQKFLLKRSL